jgi:hypothetical protein
MGSFHEDRICDLCEITANSTHQQCKISNDARIARYKLLASIKKDCPYVRTEYADHYESYDACGKPGSQRGKDAPDCNPTEDCIEIIKRRTK